MKRLTFNIFAALALLLSSCNIPLGRNSFQLDDLPKVNADSAYAIVDSLTSFGPRTPGAQRQKAISFISARLQRYGYRVVLQQATVYRYDSLELDIVNIQAFDTVTAKRRILLFTHWDTRFMAENDSDSLLRNQPIVGANDGASGVAVLLEVARVIRQKQPSVAVDFIFFDAEDQGPPSSKSLEDYWFWALGSQYWAKKKQPDYKPWFAIGVDLVGAKNTSFAIEDFSLYYYGYLVKKIWQVARQLGYDSLFVDVRTSGIFNDHVPINRFAKIRAVMIMENKPNGRFGNYWHTHDDNLHIIDKNTLEAVGNTLVAVIYNL